jgi:diacylglycerol kinase (ATP)
MQRDETAVVFVNPRAGGGIRAGRIADVRADFARRNFAATFVEPRSWEELRDSLRRACASGSRRLVAMGGDGTLQLLARETMGRGAEIGVIPTGGGNDFAAALGIRSWRQGVQAIAGGKTRAVDAIRVGFASGKPAFYLGGGGVGLDAEAARHASGRFLRWPGRLRYLAAAITALRGYRGIDIELEDENSTQKISGPVLLAAALNTPTYGGGICLAPDAQPDDGELDVVIIEMLSRLEVLKLIPRLLATGQLRTNRAKRFRAKKIRLTSDENRWFHGDGELLGQTPLEVQVVPGAIRVFAP